MSRQPEELSSGEENIESRLFESLGAVGIYPEVLEIADRKVLIADRTSSIRVRLDRLLEGLESALSDPGKRFFFKDRPFKQQIRHLSWLGRRIKGPGKQTGVSR
jgi:hypothetical protein